MRCEDCKNEDCNEPLCVCRCHEGITLSQSEAASLVKELENSWISRDNPLAEQTLNRLIAFCRK